VVRSDLLPTADMIVSMSKEFGVPLSEREMADLKPTSATADEMEQMNRERLLIPDGAELQEEYIYVDTYNTKSAAGVNNLHPNNNNNNNNNNHNQSGGVVMISTNEAVNVPHTSRYWTPIDNYNDKYLWKRKEVEQRARATDHVADNIEQVKAISERNRYKRPVKNYIVAEGPSGVAFNYSSQALNSTELALNSFRDIISQVGQNFSFFFNNTNQNGRQSASDLCKNATTPSYMICINFEIF
jgi:hypothetical protein